MPCNYVHAEIAPTNDTVAEECVRDKQEQMDYLGNIRLIFLVTEQAFNSQGFGEDAIVTRSKIYTKQIDNTKPHWIDGGLIMNQLEDEVAFLQYG